MQPIPRSLLPALALVFTLVSTSSGQPKVAETIVGPAGAGGLYVVSQRDGHIAYVGAKGTRTVVSVDGVEGPVLDELFGGSAAVISGSGPVLVHSANAGGKLTTPSAVIFSENGAHHAYIGRQGNEYVVVRDGKEIGRGPRNQLGTQHLPLSFSPEGNFVYWEEMKIEGGRGVYRLIVNGKAEVWAGHQDLVPVFSADDKRYAYNAGTVEDYKKQVLIVDGKVAGYVGFKPQFTADGKTLLTQGPNNTVLVDGKPGPYPGISVEKIVPAPVGGRFAVIMRKKVVNYEGVGTLYLDGKEVPGTEGAVNITFSPNGKRYALYCRNPESKAAFMVIDGKKGSEYQTVADKAYWTPDSANVIYQISSSGRNFVVVNEQEFPVASVNSLMKSPFPMPRRGGRYAFTSVDGSNRNFLAIIDGKSVLPAGFYPNGDSLEFSENGDRWAYAVGTIGRQGMVGIVDNGTMLDSLGIAEFFRIGDTKSRVTFILSPDGKYLARVGYTKDNKAGIYVNEKQVYAVSRQVHAMAFTPDSQHLVWIAGEPYPDKPQTQWVVYVDGEVAARVSGLEFDASKGWCVASDGAVTLTAVMGNEVKRLRITGDSSTGIEKATTAFAERQTKIAEEAAAAKKKSEDEAAAKAAKAKADADALAAKRKADAEAAAKARADAAAAKAKARADAAAAKAAARQNK